MSFAFHNTTISRMSVIDDKREVRKTFGYHVADLKVTPVPEDDPFVGGVLEGVARVRSHSDAALCDFQLRVSQYATFDGAEFVAALYVARVPAVLCTSWEKSNIDEIRPHRQAIPVLLKPSALNEDTLGRGIERCVREFEGKFDQDRKPWRTLIRCQNVDERFLYLIIPGWNSEDGVRVVKNTLPSEVLSTLSPGVRCHARVNIGAEKAEDLFFESWEV